MSEPLEPAEHAEQVLAAYGNSPNQRYNALAQAAVGHLLAFVEEVGLTRDEWFAAIQFLNAVGQMTDGARDEFILLSDALGVSMLAAMGRHIWRPAHTHFVVAADGHKPVITHLFDDASDYLDSDAAFGIRDSLIVDMSGPEVHFDFVLEKLD